MKSIFLFICFLFVSAASAQELSKPTVVDASCGQCKFGMEGKGCSLAVKIDGKPYFVDGTSLDQHGDAHADDGFCNTVRSAEVTGKVVGTRFKADSFKLLAGDKAKKK